MGKAAREPGLWDRLVNDRFDGKQPVLTGEESIKAAKLLWRKAMGRPFTGPVKLTSGNRYTWVRSGVLYVNPDKKEVHTRGLRSLIHDLSHYAHQRLHPKDDPHSPRQAYLERDLVAFAIESGFLDGKLKKPEKPKDDLVVKRYRAISDRQQNWSKKLAHAKKMFDRANREAREYERRHGDRLKIGG